MEIIKQQRGFFSMKKTLLSLIILVSLSITSSVWAGDCKEKFSWIPNIDEITIGYKILYGTTNSDYTEELDVGMPEVIDGRMNGEVLGLNCNTLIHFVCVAYSIDNISDYSNQISLNTVSTEPGRPNTPVGFVNE